MGLFHRVNYSVRQQRIIQQIVPILLTRANTIAVPKIISSSFPVASIIPFIISCIMFIFSPSCPCDHPWACFCPHHSLPTHHVFPVHHSHAIIRHLHLLLQVLFSPLGLFSISIFFRSLPSFGLGVHLAHFHLVRLHLGRNWRILLSA